MTTKKNTKNLIQDQNYDSDNLGKYQKIERRNIFSLLLGGVIAAKSFSARASGMTVNPENHYISGPILKEIRKAKYFLEKLINEKNSFYIQTQKNADYISENMTKKPDWAKMQVQKSDWYPEPLMQKMKDIALHYTNIYNVWEKLNRTNEKLSAQEKLFVAGANQHLKGAYHEVKSLVFKEIFNNIQQQVSHDKINKKIPDNLSESDAVCALSQQLLIQLQISQYAAITDILNSINILILSKNPAAFNIPENMKLPKIEDFQEILKSAISGKNYPVNLKR